MYHAVDVINHVYGTPQHPWAALKSTESLVEFLPVKLDTWFETLR